MDELHKRASLVTNITTPLTRLLITSITTESTASFSPADLFWFHLNINLFHLKWAMILNYLVDR